MYLANAKLITNTVGPPNSSSIPVPTPQNALKPSVAYEEAPAEVPKSGASVLPRRLPLQGRAKSLAPTTVVKREVRQGSRKLKTTDSGVNRRDALEWDSDLRETEELSVDLDGMYRVQGSGDACNTNALVATVM